MDSSSELFDFYGCYRDSERREFQIMERQLNMTFHQDDTMDYCSSPYSYRNEKECNSTTYCSGDHTNGNENAKNSNFKNPPTIEDEANFTQTPDLYFEQENETYSVLSKDEHFIEVEENEDFTCKPSNTQYEEQKENFPQINMEQKHEKFHKILSKEAIYKKIQTSRNDFILEKINLLLNADVNLKKYKMKNLPNLGFNSRTNINFVQATLRMSLFDVFNYKWVELLNQKEKADPKNFSSADNKKMCNNKEILDKIKMSGSDKIKKFFCLTLGEVTSLYLNSKSFKQNRRSLIEKQSENCRSWLGYCCGHCKDFKKGFDMYVFGGPSYSGYIENFSYYLNKAQESEEILCISNSSDSTI